MSKMLYIITTVDMQRNGDILYTALNRSCCNYSHFMIKSTNAVLEVRTTMYAMNNCFHKARSRKKERIVVICGNLFSGSIL